MNGLMTTWMDRPLRAQWMAPLGLALLLAGVSAFGTDRADVATRVIYWVVLTAVAAALRHLVNRQVSWTDGFVEPLARRAASGALITLFMTPLVWGANTMILGTPATAEELVALLGPVGIVAIALEMLMGLVGSSLKTRDNEPSPSFAPTLPTLLPLHLRSAVVEALQAEDHYVRVHTSKGSALIRMRLSDAINSMGNTRGLLTHRSWWVAELAIQNVRRLGNRRVAVLASGIEAPISRAVARGFARAAGPKPNNKSD